jgi:hypothetical protein
MFASGSGDKEVKFWEFDLVTDEKYSNTRSLVQLSVNFTKDLFVCMD